MGYRCFFSISRCIFVTLLLVALAAVISETVLFSIYTPPQVDPWRYFQAEESLNFINAANLRLALYIGLFGIAFTGLAVLLFLVTCFHCCCNDGCKVYVKQLFLAAILILAASTALALGIIAFRFPAKQFELTAELMAAEINRNSQTVNKTGLYYASHNSSGCCGYRFEKKCSEKYGPGEACNIGSSACSKNCVQIATREGLEGIILGINFMTFAWLIFLLGVTVGLRTVCKECCDDTHECECMCPGTSASDDEHQKLQRRTNDNAERRKTGRLDKALNVDDAFDV